MAICYADRDLIFQGNVLAATIFPTFNFIVENSAKRKYDEHGERKTNIKYKSRFFALQKNIILYFRMNLIILYYCEFIK